MDEAPDPNLPADDVLDETTAAALLRVSALTLAEMRKRGEAPPHRRVGKVIRYSRAAVLQWLRGDAVARGTEGP